MKFFVAAVLAAIAGCGEQFAKKEGPKYRFAPITRTDIVKTVEATGTVAPIKKVEVGAQVNGRIVKLLVDYNSVVTNGQVVALIDPLVYEANYRSSLGELHANEANVKKSEAQLAAERHLDFDDEREIYNAFRVQIARLEHFAVGISEETYDYETFCRLGGEHVMYLYEKVEPVITEARNCSEKVVPFTEFENLYLKLKEKYSKKTNGEV